MDATLCSDRPSSLGYDEEHRALRAAIDWRVKEPLDFSTDNTKHSTLTLGWKRKPRRPRVLVEVDVLFQHLLKERVTISQDTTLLCVCRTVMEEFPIQKNPTKWCAGSHIFGIIWTTQSIGRKPYTPSQRKTVTSALLEVLKSRCWPACTMGNSFATCLMKWCDKLLACI